MESVLARAHRPRRYPVSDGAPVEVVEDGPSIAARLVSMGTRITMWPTLAVLSHVPHWPWPFGLVDFVARAVMPTPGTVRATVGLPKPQHNSSARPVCCRPTATAASCCTCTAGRS